MKWVKYEKGQLPIYSWCESVEDNAMEQAINLSKHPCTFHRVSLMPDCHSGYGMPIGGVIACEDAVIPNCVGVDIGCGMIAVKTSLKSNELSKDNIEKSLSTLKNNIPVGFNHNKHPSGHDILRKIECKAHDLEIPTDEVISSKYQLGTLGGGNHFIEIQKGDDGYIWLMIHSGSRNFGYKIAKRFNKIAQDLCNRWHSVVCPFKGEDGLAFLPIDTEEAQKYIMSMNLALEFALANRERMMEIFKDCIISVCNCSFDDPINIHHNYAALENHFGKNVWVHRKGATSAVKGELGIIPGSMGTSSYIVRGLGNKDSFCSCSHGAGRVMGRAEFCRTHTIEECDSAMGEVVFSGWGKDRKGNTDISEAPQAYKDIDIVMESQKDLVEIVVKLTPLGVLKG